MVDSIGFTKLEVLGYEEDSEDGRQRGLRFSEFSRAGNDSRLGLDEVR